MWARVMPGVGQTLQGKMNGMREFIIRDLNRFWITFGQDVSASQALPNIILRPFKMKDRLYLLRRYKE